MMLKSVFFNILFYGITAFLAVIGIPLLLLPYVFIQHLAYFWSWVMVFLLKNIAGITHEVLGTIPERQVIYAAKHQSAWETIFLYDLLKGPAPVMKGNLVFLPLIGLYLLRVPSVFIDRKTGMSALRKLMCSSRKISGAGNNILIFPQGTRVAVGDEQPYHTGIFAIYQATGLPVVPIALNSGQCWGRDSFVKNEGVITVKLLEQIPAGLDKKAFMARLENDIEAASKSLLK